MKAVLKDFNIHSESVQCGKIALGYVITIGLGEDREHAELFQAAMSKAIDYDTHVPMDGREETTDETWASIRRCQIGVECPLRT